MHHPYLILARSIGEKPFHLPVLKQFLLKNANILLQKLYKPSSILKDLAWVKISDIRDCRKSTWKAPKLKLPEILLKLNHYAAPGQV